MNNSYNWYSQIIRPTWSPPAWLFGPVWTILYILIAYSFGTVFYKVYTKEIPAMVALPFALNLVFNFAFTPIQFGLKNNLLASVDIILILATLIWGLVYLWKVLPSGRFLVYMNIPYLVWVMFAISVQIAITYLNR